MTNIAASADHLRTTFSDTLLSLAERVEAGHGPDRLLDANILWAINPAAFDADAGDDDERLQSSYCYARGGWTLNRADRFYLDSIPVPEFTSSLDAAKTLKPDGWLSCRVGTTDDGRGYAELAGNDGFMMAEDPDEFYVESEAVVEARALTAACLRARAIGETV